MVYPKRLAHIKKTDLHRGFLLVEIMIAFILIASAFQFLIPTFMTMLDVANVGNSMHEALQITESVVASSTHNVHGIIYSQNQFMSSSTVVYETPCLLTVEATTSWKYFRLHSIHLESKAALPKMFGNYGGDCNGFSDSDSMQKFFHQETFGLFLQNASSIDAYGNNLFIGTKNASSSEFLEYSHKPDGPITLLSRLSIDPIVKIDSIGIYSFLAIDTPTNQLQILDTKDPAHPKIVSQISLPGVTGSYPAGLSLSYYNKKVYIGTHRTAGNEFHIFDVSNPKAPAWKGSIELNHNINDIVIQGSYAYLATSGNTSNIIILDVSDPTRIQKISSLSFVGPEDSTVLSILGNYLIVGRKKGSSVDHPELVTINIENPALPFIVSSLSLKTDITALEIAGNFIFASTPRGLYKIASNLNTLSVIDQIGSIIGQSLDINSNQLFILGSTSLTKLSP
jgi:hypothetical protein